MSNFSDEAAKFQSQPIALFELVIGSLTKRWSTVDVDVAGAGFYEGRISQFGVIDRKFTDGGSGAGDLTITIANEDGDVDDLLTSFSDANLNILRATATVKLGFSAIAYADYETQAVYQYAEIVEQSNRSVTLRFTEQKDKLFGIIRCPLDTDVMTQLETSFASDFPGSKLLSGAEDRLVPIAFGHWSIDTGEALDGLATMPTHSQNGMRETVYIVAVSPEPFDETRSDAKWVWYESSGSRITITADVELGSGASVKVDSYDMSGTLGYHALVIRSELKHVVEDTGGVSAFFRGEMRIGAMPSISGTVRSPTPSELISKIITAFTSKSSDPWISANVDLASFTTMDEHLSQMKCRARIWPEIDSLYFMGKVAEPFLAELYFNRAGKFAAHTLEIEGGPSPVYASAMDITEADVVLEGISAKTSESGRHAVVNRVTIETALPQNHTTKMLYTTDNATSESEHDRWVTKEMKTFIIYDIDTARLVAEEMLYRNENPRMVVTVPLPLSAADRELGDIVKLTTTEIAGFSGGKYCVIGGYRTDLDRFRIEADVVDFDSFLRTKPYILDLESNWLVVSGGIIALTVTGASATVSTPSAKFGDVLAQDILQIGGWPGGYRSGAGKNNLNCVIASVTSSLELVLEAGGGEDGSIPSDSEAVEGAGWRIVRGQVNRGTSGGSYTARSSKYGVLSAEADGLFRDDSTPSFTAGEG